MKIIASVFVALSLSIPQLLMCQWQQTNGPYGGPVNALTVDGSILLAGTNVGVYRSTNNGALWTDATLTNTAVNALFLDGTALFAGTNIGVYRSTDHGLSWTQANTGLTDLHVNDFAAETGVLYAGTNGGVFRSSNGGTTWLSTGALSIPVISIEVTTDGAGGSLLYAGCRTKSQDASGLFLSTDRGITWTKLGVPSNKSFIEFDGELSAVRDSLYAGAYTKDHYIALENGHRVFACNPKTDPRSWAVWPCVLIPRFGGFGSTPIPPTGDPAGIVRYGWTNNSAVYVQNMDKSSLGRVGRRRDNIRSALMPLAWDFLEPEGGRPIVVESGSNVFSASASGSVWISGKVSSNGVDYYATTERIDQGMLNSEPYVLAWLPGTNGTKKLTAVTSFNNNIFQSADRGATWTMSAAAPGSVVLALVSVPSVGGGSTAFAATTTGVFKSADGGSNWSKVRLEAYADPGMVGLTVQGGTLLGATEHLIYRSSDSGLSWESIKPPVSDISTIGVGPSTLTGTSVFIASSAGLCRSTDIGKTWVKVGSPTSGNETVISFATNGPAMFALVSRLGVFRSYDNGDTWEPASSGLHTAELTSMTSCGSRLFVTSDGYGVLASVDNGGSWNAVNEGLTSLSAFSMVSDSTDLYVGTASGVLRYTGSIAPAANLTPAVSVLAAVGTPFWVEVKVGDLIPVTDLAFISFYLSSNQSFCTYVDSTAIHGPFLTKPAPSIGTIIPSSVYWKPDAQTVSITLQWQLKPGMSGQGVVAKAQFTTPTTITTASEVKFSITNIRAMNSDGNSIDLAPGLATVHVIVGGGEVWPGDCNNDGAVNAADILPIGVYYGQMLGMQNQPGMVWRGYLREGWSADVGKKKLLADANGDGTVNSADVLAVGLNYGKTHQPVVLGKTVSPQLADGVLQVGSAENKAALAGTLRIPITLKSSKPVYGVAFNLKYGTNSSSNVSSVKLLRVDTASSMLGGGLMVSRISNEESLAEIGLTQTQGVGATRGVVLNLVFDAPSKDPLWVEVSNVTGNDEHGNAVNLSGSVFRSDAEGAPGSSSIPTENALLQNYPNPFNPATSIRFQLSDASMVSIKMFDILGREVVTLVNEERAAGSYTVRWDATGVPSGIYCCRLAVRNQAGQVFMQTRRMTFVK
jgi:photosystem II stability/assembly factor-like uncharacterized protein